MDLPVALERSFGLFGKRLLGRVHEVGVAALLYDWTVLQHVRDAADEELDEEQEEKSRGTELLLAALAALGITWNALLNEAALRAALVRVARSNDQRVKNQLANALGRPVSVGVEEEINAWVDAQVKRIQKLVEQWRSSVATTIETPPGDLDFEGVVLALATKKSKAERSAFTTTAAGLLLLNSALVVANAVGAGVNSYIWRTEGDDRVREWHAELDGTVQSFNSPPVGGGTAEGDIGSPGEGINCRCIAEVIIA